MKCPYCNEEMQAGVIQSPNEISWHEKRSFIGNGEFDMDRIVLSELSLLKGSAVRAFCCKKCEKIVIDFQNGSCDLNRRK